MSEYRSPWDDPNVKEALKERPASDITLICCNRCGNLGYYNEGSHFTCSACNWSISGHKLDAIIEEVGVEMLSDEYGDGYPYEPEKPA